MTYIRAAHGFAAKIRKRITVLGEAGLNPRDIGSSIACCHRFLRRGLPSFIDVSSSLQRVSAKEIIKVAI